MYFAPKGLQHTSPGQRPGTRYAETNSALKGRNNQTAGRERSFVTPFQGYYATAVLDSRGVAPGWYVAAPSGRKTESVTPHRITVKTGTSCLFEYFLTRSAVYRFPPFPPVSADGPRLRTRLARFRDFSLANLTAGRCCRCHHRSRNAAMEFPDKGLFGLCVHTYTFPGPPTGVDPNFVPSRLPWTAVANNWLGGFYQEQALAGGAHASIRLPNQKNSFLLLDVFFNPCDTQACTD